VVFLCGAKPNLDAPCARDRILQYAKKHLSHFHFFMAEDVFSTLPSSPEIDLVELEKRLTGYSDCIIIVLESESAYAELGAFTFQDELAKMVMVISDSQHKNSSSFISQGPVARIKKHSRFKPTIYVNLGSVLTAAQEVSKSLEQIDKKYNKREPLQSFEEFKSCTPKIRMLFLHDLISIYAPLSHNELIFILKEFYGDFKFDINVELSLLQALKRVKKIDGNFLVSSAGSTLFFDFRGANVIKIRVDIVNHYHKYFKVRTKALKKRCGVLH